MSITECQFCYKQIKLGMKYVDGKTKMGPWAHMCRECHEENGVGFGTGKGQLIKIDRRHGPIKIRG